MAAQRPDLDSRLTLRKGRNAESRYKLILGIKNRKYGVGKHGSAPSTRRALGVTGARFNSEHPIGFEVYAQGQQRRSGSGAQNEKAGMAYLEVGSRHGGHPGTGSGARATQYRLNQRGIFEEGEPNAISNAVQLNQLEYAHLPRAIENGPTLQERTIAALSYESMVRNVSSMSFFSAGGSTSFGISQLEQAEMLLAFRVRETGLWPTSQEIRDILTSVDLDYLVDLY